MSEILQRSQPETSLEATGFIVGVDLGQHNEHTAVAVNERHMLKDGPRVVHHWLTWLHRFPIGTSYPDVISAVRRLIEQLPKRRDRLELVVDSTGVGRSVVTAMEDAGLEPFGVTITAGADAMKRAANDWRVPKRELAGLMQMALQSGRLKVAEGMPLTPVFKRELEGFKAKVNTAAAEDFEAWREQEHDDLVLAAAVAVWWAEEEAKGYDTSMSWVG